MNSPVQLTIPQWPRGLTVSALTFVLSFLLLSYVVSYIDNPTMLTANGLWKTTDIQKWYQNSPDKQFQPAEILYEPTYALMSRALPDHLFLVQKMPIVNSFFGALALSFYFFLLFILTGNVWASLLGVVFHLGTAFFLGLNISSEDIMPAYAFFIGAICFFTLYAKHSWKLYLFIGTQLFALAFLFHWTILLPGLPAIALALFFLHANMTRAIKDVALFLLLVMILPILVAMVGGQYLGPSTENPSFLQNLQMIMWPGKGLDTGWGGFKAEKVIFALSGMSEYLIGGNNTSNINLILMSESIQMMAMGLGVLVFLMIFFGIWLNKNWTNPAHRTAGIILGTTFLFGISMNLYIQPQDPQFVIQPLAWVPFSFSMFVFVALSKLGSPRALYLAPLFLLVAILPFYINLTNFFLPQKGATDKALAILKTLEEKFHPDHTVFVIHGFEPLAPWAHVVWGPCVLANFSPYRPDQCHFIHLIGEAIHHPTRTPLASAQATTDRMTQALRLGKKVVVNSIWEYSEQEFIDSFNFAATQEKAQIQYEKLHETFKGKFVLDSSWGKFFELKMKRSFSK